ncbi:hypothetical protein HCB18_09390 [Salinispora arenicola]|uniref:hypothetical protein n=1 Tax=Salinispora arenicola TaxID=168697 RepID=UPI00169CE7C2|nr:hypothetical protein [Salinispora arenicola]NIL57133.1 hypothetical protein [Salinispora arenicola]
MNNPDDTDEAIVELLERRAHAEPPRWMTAATKAVGLIATADATAFAIHATASLDRTGMGVTLGLHVALFAVIVLTAVLLGSTLARIRLDIARAAQQDRLDAYRQQRTVDLVRDAVRDILDARDRADKQRRWESFLTHTGAGGPPTLPHPHGDSVVPFTRRPESARNSG